MPALSFIGCLLTAYGPSAALFAMVAVKSAPRVLLTLANAFFALIALFCTSLVWFGIASAIQRSDILAKDPGLDAGIISFSVAFQEALRLASWKILSLSEGHIDIASVNERSNATRIMYSFVSGLGFGSMMALTTYIPMLVETAGPGVLLLSGCPGISALFLAAISTMLLVFHHIVWTMLMYEGLWHAKKGLVVWTVFSHYLVSYSSILASGVASNTSCVYPIIISVVILLISTKFVFNFTTRAVRMRIENR